MTRNKFLPKKSVRKIPRKWSYPGWFFIIFSIGILWIVYFKGKSRPSSETNEGMVLLIPVSESRS